MTIEELLELPAKDIAALTDKQLESHLRKYFPYTRPSGVIEHSLAVSLNKSAAAIDELPDVSKYERLLEEKHNKAKLDAAASSKIALGIRLPPAKVPPTKR